jgi:predicted nucleotidyltransferase
MTKQRSAPIEFPPPRRYRSPDIPMAVIRRYARQIAERFHPNKIILFGSYAYGTPHEDSDVDLMVVMPAANDVSQAVRIRFALPAPFPMDLLVRTPDDLRRGVQESDWFLREVVEKGKVLYDAKNGRVGAKSRVGHRGRTRDRKRKTPAF